MAALAGSLISTIATFAGANAQANALKTQGDFEAQVAESNARMAEIQADDAIRRGEKDAQAIGQKARQVQGSQRAALAAQGINVDVGSAADVQQDTVTLSELDKATVRGNAWREAWGLRAQADEYRVKGRFAQSAGRFAGRSTLITGGLKGLGMAVDGVGAWAERRGARKPPRDADLLADFDPRYHSYS